MLSVCLVFHTCSDIYKTLRKRFTPVDTTPLQRLCENKDLGIDKLETAFSDGTDDQLLLTTIFKETYWWKMCTLQQL